MKVYYVQGTNLSEDADWEFLQNTFKPFGKILKTYIHPQRTFCKVYFNSKESAEEAFLTLNGQPPHHLNLSIDSDISTNPKFQQPDNQSNISDNHSSNMSLNDYNDVNDVYAESGPTLYNIYGICITSLTADDGSLYVPLDEVKSIGFELFEDGAIPKHIDFNQQMILEFKAYLNAKARKYMRYMKCVIPEKVVEETKNEIINKYVSNVTPRTQRQPVEAPRTQRQSFEPPRTQRQSIEAPRTQRHSIEPSRTQRQSVETRNPRANQSNGTPNGFHSRTSFNDPSRQRATQPEHHKPLRRPNTTPSDFKTPSPQSTESTDLKWRPKNENISRSGRTTSFDKEKEYINKSGTCEREKENISPRMPAKSVERAERPQHPSLMALSPVKYVELPLNKKITVTVAHIESPKKCWVYMKSDEKLAEQILYDTNQEAVNKPNAKPAIGQICATTFLGAWYRAIILEVSPVTKVRYIDFGNTDEVNDVRELSNALITQHAIAVCVEFLKPPSKSLEESAELDIMPVKKISDDHYEVEEFVERKSSDISDLNLVPAGKTIMSRKEESPGSKSPISVKNKVPVSSSSTVTENVSLSRPNSANTSIKMDKVVEDVQKLSLKDKLAKMSNAEKVKSLNPDRKSVVDLIAEDEGTVQFLEKIDENRCLCYIMAPTFTNELFALESIAVESEDADKFIGRIGETVCVKQKDSDGWVRATIVNIVKDQYIVALIDYGEVITVDRVAQLPKKYMDIPEFTFVCTAKAECIELMKKSKGELEFTSKESNKITVALDKVDYVLTCARWDPFETSKSNRVEEKPSQPVAFTTAPAVKELKDSEIVLPITVNEGKLLVRTKDTTMLLSKINKEIPEHSASHLTQKPIINQLVLCPHDSKPVLCRGIIKALDGDNLHVYFIDHGFMDFAPLGSLKNISESLAGYDSTLIPLTLKGFEDGEYTSDAIECIETYCQARKKFVAKKCPNDTFDLMDDEKNSLSAKFKKIAAPDDRILYKDIGQRELQLGTTEQVILITYEQNNGPFVFMLVNDAAQLCELTENISKYAETATDYSPQVDEVCLANYEGEWCRARIMSANMAVGEYEVYYMDYGNTAQVSPSEIRKLPKEFAQIPGVALHCCLRELTGSAITSDILDLLKEEISQGASSEVKILRKVDSLYEISIPSLSAEFLEKLIF